MSDFERRLTEALTSGAEGAPDADRLAVGARTRAKSRRRTRYAVVAGAVVVALAVPVGILALNGDGGGSSDGPPIATDPTNDPPATWHTIEYEGVQVDVPGGWTQLDTSSCEFQMDRFGPPETDPCKYEGESLNFYGSALFDPAHGPGLLREGSAWAGYVYAGEWAVYTTAPDKDTGRQILGSVREAGEDVPQIRGWRTESYDGLAVDVPDSWRRGGLSAWCLDKKVDGWVEDPDTMVAAIACTPSNGYGVRFGRGASDDDSGFTERDGPEYPEHSWAGVAIVPDESGTPIGFVEIVAPTRALAELIGGSLRVQ